MKPNELDDSDCVISDFNVDVITPSQVPPNAKVILEGTDNVQPCPPELAVQAIEAALTPKKRAKFENCYARGKDNPSDPVYATWRYLRDQVIGTRTPELPTLVEHPLVKSGLIPKRLAQVFQIPPEKKKYTRVSRGDAIILTSEEISHQITERENSRRTSKGKKEPRNNPRSTQRICVKSEPKKRKMETNEIQRKKKTVPKKNQPKSTKTNGLPRSPYDQPIPTERQRYFSYVQQVLMACKSFAAIEEIINTVDIKYDLPTASMPTASTPNELSNDAAADHLLEASGHQDMRSVSILADGNCLPRTGSALLTGEESMHVEIRVLIALELVLNKSTYLDENFLSLGRKEPRRPNICARYATYSPGYNPDNDLTPKEIERLYEDEVLEIIKPNSYCGIWQLHALATVLECPIRSIYPGNGPPKTDLDREILPRHSQEPQGQPRRCIMWSSTSNVNLQSWWQPNHFVPVRKISNVVNKMQLSISGAVMGICYRIPVKSNVCCFNIHFFLHILSVYVDMLSHSEAIWRQ